jgi:hypothetical protein
MLTGLPRVSWRRFFRRLTAREQRSLERALTECDLLLGEYMELVERAYLEAYALREAGPGRERADLDLAAHAIAARLIGGYVRRKRLFLLLTVLRQGLASAKLAGALPRETYAADFPEGGPPSRFALSPSCKRRLRQRIHAQIEAMRTRKGIASGLSMTEGT